MANRETIGRTIVEVDERRNRQHPSRRSRDRPEPDPDHRRRADARSARARANGSAFALGWLVGLLGVSIVVLVVTGGADDPNGAAVRHRRLGQGRLRGAVPRTGRSHVAQSPGQG